MQCTFLGSGSAFTVGGNNYQSNMLLEASSGQKLLIDCGSDARLSLHERGFTYRDINSVYLSHLHADHIGGLEWLAFSTKFDPTCGKPNLYLAPDLIDDLWNFSLRGGLCSLATEKATLCSYFNLHPIYDDHFKWEKTSFYTVPTLHVSDSVHKLSSYGLRFAVNGREILITTDTCLQESLYTLYEHSSLIFHDCETAPHKSGVHAHYTELKLLPPEIKRKMWLYHYQPGPLPHATEDGFSGFVTKGQLFDLANPATFPSPVHS